MHGSPYAALDAGIPTDAPFVEDKPDNRDDAAALHRNMVKRMVWWLRVAGGPDGPTTDKMDAATQLSRHGFTAADILDNIDEVIARIEFEEKAIAAADRTAHVVIGPARLWQPTQSAYVDTSA